MSAFMSALLALTLVVQPALAAPFPFSLPWFQDIDLTEDQQVLMQQLQDKYVPEIEEILYPDQRERFEEAIQDGYSMRRAFREMYLSPEQKTELASVVKQIPKSSIFASLTPDQKKEIFMKKKEMFMPTAEEIQERIRAGMEAKQQLTLTLPIQKWLLQLRKLPKRLRLVLKRKKPSCPALKISKKRFQSKWKPL